MKQKSDRRQSRHGFGLWYYVCMCVPFVLFGAYLFIGTLEPADPYAGSPLPPSSFEPFGFKTPLEKLLPTPPTKEGNAAEIYEMIAKSIDGSKGTAPASPDRYGQIPTGGLASRGGFAGLGGGGMRMSGVFVYPLMQIIDGFTATDEQIRLLVDAAQMRTCEFSDESPWESKDAYTTLQDALVCRAKECEDRGETDEAIELFGAAIVLNHHLEAELSRPRAGALHQPLSMNGLNEGYQVVLFFRELAAKGLSRCYTAKGDTERPLLYDRHIDDLQPLMGEFHSLRRRIRLSPYVASEVLMKHADPRFRIDAARALAVHANKNVRLVLDIVPYPNAAQQRLALQALREAAKKETNPHVLEAINEALEDYAAGAAR